MNVDFLASECCILDLVFRNVIISVFLGPLTHTYPKKPKH